MSAVDKVTAIRDQLAEVVDAYDELATEIGDLNEELEAGAEENRQLRDELEEADVDWVTPYKDWHDEAHSGPFRFCDQRPCDVLRVLAGVRA